MVHNANDEEEEEEDEDDWLYELLAELSYSNDSDDEEVEEEAEKEVDDEVVEEETEGETFFISIIFSGNKVTEPEIPIKCEDPGPCLVTCKIRGVDISEFLCDPGACDASIVVIAGIAENVFGKVGNTTEVFHLTCPPAPRKKSARQFQISNAEIKPDKPLKNAK
ncbi:hypothetical protein PIB30_090031 [Stylosanthes scabra]|uniref:Nucleoplasmin-like domain-containing protein n=1 Tax=Stylosanthes scabra TaxID=79078 RepID=A0ABU6ZST2_9FABA|nr:hypothetical protein [Stylosanthes scabra]